MARVTRRNSAARGTSILPDSFPAEGRRDVWTFAHRAVVSSVLAGCASATPRWVHHVPDGRAHEYVVGMGHAGDPASARRAAVSQALARVAEGGEVRVQVTRQDTIVRDERIEGGARVERVQRYRGTLVVDAAASPVTALALQVVDEHLERSADGMDAWVLMRRPRLAGVRRVPTTTELALRSAVLPGWGQFTRGQPRRGAVVLGAVVLAVPTALVLDAVRADATLQARRARTAPAREYWRDRANAFGAARTGAGAVGVTAWAFGVVDGALPHPHVFMSRAADGRAWRIGAALPAGPARR